MLFVSGERVSRGFWEPLSGCGVSGGKVVEGCVAFTDQHSAYKKLGWSEE